MSDEGVTLQERETLLRGGWERCREAAIQIARRERLGLLVDWCFLAGGFWVRGEEGEWVGTFPFGEEV